MVAFEICDSTGHGRGAGNSYTNRLYQKIAERTNTFESADGYGTFHHVCREL